MLLRQPPFFVASRPLRRRISACSRRSLCGFAQVREPLKTPKSRLAAEAEAELTEVNEYFAERA